MKMSVSRFKQNCLISLFSLLFVLVSLEIGIRVYDVFKLRAPFLSSDPRNPFAARLFTEHPLAVVPFRMFGFDLYKETAGARFISSRHGELYPLEKPKGTFRVVCFGGSTTEQEINGKHYPLMLQSLLRERLKRDNIEVINVGNSAYATPHLLILLELDVIYWKPDLVILSENINDLSAQYFRNFTFDYSNKYSNPFFTAPDYASRYTLPNLIFKNSRLYWFLKSKWEKIAINGGNTHQRRPIRRRSYGDTPSPVAAEVFEQNLNSFIVLAQSRGIKVLLSTQPLQPSERNFVRANAYKPYNDIVFYPRQDEFVKHHRFFNGSIKSVASTRGVLFVDNDQIMGGREEYFIDSVHYSKTGLERLARNYADFIISNGVVSKEH